jgi:hypothetical protein
MWVQRTVCRLLALNVGSLAAIVSLTLRLLAPNVSRKCPLFAGLSAAVCKPLQLPVLGALADRAVGAGPRSRGVARARRTGESRGVRWPALGGGGLGQEP